MAITLKSLIALAKGKHSIPCLRSVVFDGKSAMCAAPMDWVAGVPCPQDHITEPVAVPVDAILAHLAKSRHLVVMPDHLTNGQGLKTPFSPGKVDYSCALDFLPSMPETDAVTFDLELDALDRVLVVTPEEDIRYYLRGVLMDLSHGVMVGTDGHRMHLYRNRVPVVYPMRLEDGSYRPGGAVQWNVPRDPLKWMVHSAGQFAKVTVFNPLLEKGGESALSCGVLLQADDAFVWVRKPIEGRFPDYERVTPAVLTRPVWASLDPVKFADVLGSMAKVARLKSEKFHSVLIDFAGGKVSVDTDQAQVMPFDVALHSDDASLDLPGLADCLWMGVEPGYVQDLADCVTPGAQWRVSHEKMMDHALMVVDGDFIGVVMPCRVNGPVEAKKPAPVAVPEPVAVPQAQEAQEEPEDAPPEPCPAAVADMAARLVGSAQASARKARKGRKVPAAEPVEA